MRQEMLVIARKSYQWDKNGFPLRKIQIKCTANSVFLEAGGGGQGGKPLYVYNCYITHKVWHSTKISRRIW